jgi:hypothetical protein
VFEVIVCCMQHAAHCTHATQHTHLYRTLQRCRSQRRMSLMQSQSTVQPSAVASGVIATSLLCVLALVMNTKGGREPHALASRSRRVSISRAEPARYDTCGGTAEVPGQGDEP